MYSDLSALNRFYLSYEYVTVFAVLSGAYLSARSLSSLVFSMFIVRPITTCRWSAAIAASACSTQVNETKPKPRDCPVSRSSVISQRSSGPNFSNSARRSIDLLKRSQKTSESPARAANPTRVAGEPGRVRARRRGVRLERGGHELVEQLARPERLAVLPAEQSLVDERADRRRRPHAQRRPTVPPPRRQRSELALAPTHRLAGRRQVGRLYSSDEALQLA